MEKDKLNTTLKVGSKTVLFLIISALLNYQTVLGQDSLAKVSFSMTVRSIVSNGVRTVKVNAVRKENKKKFPVDDLRSPLNLYLYEVKDHDPATGTGYINKAYLDNEGEAIFTFPDWFYKLPDTLHKFTFIVKMVSDLKYEDAEEQITVSDAKINLQYFGEDSIKTATASLSGWKEGAYNIVPGVELKLCIKRTFNFLPFVQAGATTDEKGEISGELPLDLPGNANRTLTLAARLEDDENYGTVEVTKDVPWSILPKQNPKRGRTLWSTGDNAPLVLVISSVAIIAIIWGTIFYLISLLFKIKRLGKAKEL